MATEFELIVPCYNEAQSLPALCARTVQAAREAGLGPDKFQLILVDNGSTDETVQTIARLFSADGGDYLRYVTVFPNRGYGGGIQVGLRESRAPWVGYCHADLQCDPRDALEAYRQAREGGPRTLVQGRRFGRRGSDRFVSAVFAFCARILLGVRTREINAPPKVFHRDLLPFLQGGPAHVAWDLFVVLRASQRGFSFRFLEVAWPPRAHGVSHWAFNWRSRSRTILAVLRSAWRMRRQWGTVLRTSTQKTS